MIQCKNVGSEYDSEDIQWSCSAAMPSFFKLGRTDVVCEGYSGSDDKYVLKGSCFVEYTLHLTKKGQRHYKKQTYLFSKLENIKDTWSSTLISYSIVFFILYIFYLVLKRIRRVSQNWRPRNWFGGNGNDYPRGPPPPYSRPPYDKTFNSYTSSWRPGFWSGLLGGAALSYMMRDSRRPYTYFNRTPHSYEFWDNEYRHDYSDMDENISTNTMRTSTGFGGTRRR